MSGSIDHRIRTDPIKIFGRVSPQVFLAIKASGHFNEKFDEFFEALIMKQLQKEGFMDKSPKKAKKKVDRGEV